MNVVRQHATRTKCQSNMRQLGNAVVQYESNYNQYLPYCNWATNVDSTDVYPVGWLFSFPQLRSGYPATSDLNGNWLGLPHPPADGMETGSLWQFIGTHDVYHCPGDNPDFYVGTEWMTSYLMNGSACGYGKVGNASNRPSTPSCLVTQVGSISECVLFWEAMEQKYENQSLTGAVWNDGSSYPSEEVLADRHTHGANVAFLDNHVEWWYPEKWTGWVNAYPNGQLWWSPFSNDGH